MFTNFGSGPDNLTTATCTNSETDTSWGKDSGVKLVLTNLKKCKLDVCYVRNFCTSLLKHNEYSTFFLASSRTAHNIIIKLRVIQSEIIFPIISYSHFVAGVLYSFRSVNSRSAELGYQSAAKSSLLEVSEELQLRPKTYQ